MEIAVLTAVGGSKTDASNVQMSPSGEIDSQRMQTSKALNRQNSGGNESQSVEWYSEGEERTVEVGGVQVTVRFVGRKGRRGRICVVAPAGAVFRSGHED